jgi:hypothetical protein
MQPAAELTAFSFDRISLDFTQTRPQNTNAETNSTSKTNAPSSRITPDLKESFSKKTNVASNHAQHLPEVLCRYCRRLQDLRQLWLGKTDLELWFRDYNHRFYGFSD